MLKNNDFSDITLGRRSIRVYDETVKISREEMLEMIQKATRAPSSVNLQPWRFVAVDSDEGKAKLRPLVRWNTKQNDTSSAMLLIFGDLQCYEYADEIYDKAVAEGKMSEKEKNEQLAGIIPLYESFNKEKMKKAVRLDSALAAMQFMLVARSHGYDTNPIAGFEHGQLAEAVGLDKERYVPVLILSVGKALETGEETVRLDAVKITTFL
ncbi:nitroreductase family protein [Alkalibacterium sp. 20]|uniref:nitroreductase family protein n=1 Tax=Alkalibacterium sp. 20 TaxID=1798803 RepID=UPI0009001CCE|nr:nitroreductase family protein [Alkalibacterium sp. 20]OJF94649.1 NAD(P)H nitroreductase [Alkalibacterium sp. 20]